MAGPVRPNLKLSDDATQDIGSAAADALLRREFRGKQTHELQGQRDLDYVRLPAIIARRLETFARVYSGAGRTTARRMVQMGMSASFVGLILKWRGL